MSKSTTQASTGGIGLFGMIFIVFLVGKLFNLGALGAWSWWLVTAPLWGPLAFILCLLAIMGVVALIATLFK